MCNRSAPMRFSNDLTSLKVLKLNHNANDRLGADIYFPDEVLVQVKSLQTLFMDGLINNTLGPGFLNLVNLTSLIFSGEKNVGYCEFKTISSEMFKNVPYLQSLIIRACKVEHIHEQAFSPLSHLHLLDLSGNKKLEINGSTLGFKGLKNTSIKVLKLNNIYTNFHIGIKIKQEHIEMLRNTSITEIECIGNSLEMIDSGAFSVMPINLTKLNISINRFLMGDYLFRTILLKNLTILDASYQFFSPIDEINFRKRDIANFLGISNWTNLTIQIPENLKRATFSRSKLAFPVLNFGIGKNSLEYLDASYAMLYKWTGPVYGFDKLTYLDLSNNHCSELSFQFFDYLPRLVTLIVSNNLLGIVIPKDASGEIFKNLSTLLHLDLSNNKIPSLNENIFRGLVRIQRLNLSHNLLNTFLVNISHMKNLRVLDLSKNTLQVVSYPVRIALEDIASMTTEKVYVNISCNQLQCMCTTTRFMTWLQDTKTNVVGMTFCVQENGTKVELENKNNFIHYLDSLDKKCMSKIGLIFGTVISISIAIVIIVVGIAYRYRWKLRYLYYMTMNRSRGYNPISNSDIDNDFVYDAFVSFADEDREFVRDLMLKKMEHERGIRLCVSFRDFVPGREIASNIIEAIHNSRKTVMVLTESFLLSKWCAYEFQMARQEAIHSGRDTFFVILYEDIPAEQIYSVVNMRDVFLSNSYIEYPHVNTLNFHEQALDMFWDRCTLAIKER
ncbi:hypothetical protein ACJMK2_016119 [Sinanodonta woodiana]|uniref:TIR domain-containing protein n=1 Tax=Sinanodonta woodiana TaxID=1069815 RepID=A0ABD3UVF0_SINWO